MEYVFVFLLVSSLSVGLVTYVLSVTVFFRSGSTIERYFVVFLTFFTLRVIGDTAEFYLLPFIAAQGPALYFLFLAGRITGGGAFTLLILIAHKLTLLYEGPRSRIVVRVLLAALFVLFVAEFAIGHIGRTLTIQDLYVYSPVDSVYFVAVAYVTVVFFAFSRRIRSRTLYVHLRAFVIVMAVGLPFLVLEDLLGPIHMPAGFLPGSRAEVRLFPVYYTVCYIYLLVGGFHRLAEEKRIGLQPHAITPAFMGRFGITGREREVIALVGEGCSNKEIADKLFISSATVRNHLHNVFEKTGVSNRVELLRLASE